MLGDSAGSTPTESQMTPMSRLEWEHIQQAMTDSQGNVYRQVSGGSDPYTFTVDDNGYNYAVRWYFPPMADESETYSLGYTVHGGLRF